MLRYRYVFRVEMLRYRYVIRVEMLRYRYVFRVEADTAQFGSTKKGTKRTFMGRTLVLQSRSNKGWNVFPLKSKETTGKRGAGGPESKAEVEAILRNKLKRGCLLAADGSPAFQSAAKSLKIPSLKGVSHLKKVFTPVAVLPKKNLGAFAHRTLHKATLGSTPTTKENKK